MENLDSPACNIPPTIKITAVIDDFSLTKVINLSFKTYIHIRNLNCYFLYIYHVKHTRGTHTPMGQTYLKQFLGKK